MVDARAIAWVEGWLGQLGTVLSHIATPAIQVRAEGQARFSLSNGQTFSLNQMLSVGSSFSKGVSAGWGLRN
jgi:hypothetical protein